MLAARDQENLAFSQQHGAAVKQQQQQGATSRQHAPKTPGARYPKTPIKVPLNDENGAMTVKGNNENGMTSKAMKSSRSNFVTPMAQRARAVLGDKTTNAKAKGLQTANGKSVAGEGKATLRSKLREAQAETQKLQVHVQDEDAGTDDEVEYCPPKPKELPYESDVFPDGVLTFDALKPENLMKGYHRYYFNPIDENGVSKRDKQLQEATKKAIEEGEKKIREDLENFDWGVTGEKESDTVKPAKKTPITSKPQPVARQPLATSRFKQAAKTLAMENATKSVQRRTVKPFELSRPVHRQSPFTAANSKLRKQASARPLVPRKSASRLDATSRTTIGYNKGRSTASLLSKTKTLAIRPKKEASPTASTSIAPSTSTRSLATARPVTAHSNASEKAVASSSNLVLRPAASAAAAAAAAAAAEDKEWKERVPFLSLFNTDASSNNDDDNDANNDEEEEEEDILGIKNKEPDFLDDYENNEFELKLDDD